MGSSASVILDEEIARPADASDVPDGAAAKEEVTRLRALLAEHLTTIDVVVIDAVDADDAVDAVVDAAVIDDDVPVGAAAFDYDKHLASLVPVVLAKVCATFKGMLDTGKTMKELFLAFDEDDNGGVDPEELREGFEGLNVLFNDNEWNAFIQCWMGEEEELEFPAFEAAVQKMLEE